MRPFLCLAGLAVVLAGCAVQGPYADDATVAAVSYQNPAPASITLYTMIRNSTGSGGHSSLLINASEQVIFDPAGSFNYELTPERNDVLFGITPRLEQAYRSAHARSTYHVLSQTIQLTPEQAEMAYQLALQNGSVAGAFCANATSTLLSRLPGFETIRTTMFPTNLADQFSALPGVTEDRYYEDDNPDLQVSLEQARQDLAD